MRPIRSPMDGSLWRLGNHANAVSGPRRQPQVDAALTRRAGRQHPSLDGRGPGQRLQAEDAGSPRARPRPPSPPPSPSGRRSSPRIRPRRPRGSWSSPPSGTSATTSWPRRATSSGCDACATRRCTFSESGVDWRGTARYYWRNPRPFGRRRLVGRAQAGRF